MKKKVIAGVAGVVVAGVIIVGSGALSSKTDEQLILEALDAAVKAGQEGRPGSVIEFLANDFAVNGEKFSMGQIAKRIKDLKPKVEFATKAPDISGDGAKLISDVKLSVSLPPMSVPLKSVNVAFEKRNTTRWLIFPAKSWQITSVTLPEESYRDAASQFGYDPGTF